MTRTKKGLVLGVSIILIGLLGFALLHRNLKEKHSRDQLIILDRPLRAGRGQTA